MFAESYMGVSPQQAKNFDKVFAEFFNKVKPSTIIEIGTASGATSLILNKTLKQNNHNFKFYTYDIIYRFSHNLLVNDGIEVRPYNIFTEDYQEFNDVHYNELVSSINREGVTVVLCDGGNKKMEFRLLSKIIKPGDYIMGHDYARSVDFFQTNIYNKIWNWCEITHSDIEDAVKKNKLEPFMEEEFEKIVWVCKRKPITH